jgi:predicted nucleic acid-binding protein
VIVYIDASALVKRYVDEAGSPTVRAVVAREVIATSRLSEIEIGSGLVRRFREAGISARNLERTLSSLREDIRSIAVVELDEEVTGEAVALLIRHRLRASDAVQLASCLHLRRLASTEVRLLAYDNRLNDAARAEGLAVGV